jgi:hypothetical protein
VVKKLFFFEKTCAHFVHKKKQKKKKLFTALNNWKNEKSVKKTYVFLHVFCTFCALFVHLKNVKNMKTVFFGFFVLEKKKVKIWKKHKKKKNFFCAP